MDKPAFGLFWCFFFFIYILLSSQKSEAQNPTTDPSEVSALNTIFARWNLKANATWNISGEPCTGTAIYTTTEYIDNSTIHPNPAIKCDCSFDDNTTCHITQLKVQSKRGKGEIPKEITALKFLTYFKLDFNYFSGPLPTFLGELSAMQYLSFTHNNFHGAVPKEFGNLKDLRMLGLGSNNFSGTLPPELGNCLKLEQLYVDSCGISGEFPSTFAKLRNMRFMYALDSPFSGKIPNFIGNWTKLENLTFQGNSFEGPIPPSFSQLTSLVSLRIGDIYKGTSSLDFIKTLKNLHHLVLRNALITDTIPPDIGEFKNLVTLDLSFNNLTGEIPRSFFLLPNLTKIFLGNNSLTGTLPSELKYAKNLDLSYNFFSGSLPEWVASIGINKNLVANNFIIDSSTESYIPGLLCLQRDFPCHRKTAYPRFSIKCGGNNITGNDGTLYESDMEHLGPAKSYISVSEKWAVSKVGLYDDKTAKEDLESTTVNVSTGYYEKSEIFRTARMSPGSLRYYGLGLRNGLYNIELQFAEIGFPNRESEVWDGLAKRVFNIYIQGILREEDFNIAKEAHGVEEAIVKRYSANVTDNHLEIHLFWAGKGTCCIPKEGYYGPLIASVRAESADSDFPQTTNGGNKTGLIVGITIPLVVVGLLVLGVIFYMRRRAYHEEEEVELLGIGPRPDTFSYAEIRAATEEFNPLNKLGEGGFGTVYKGTLADGKVVAVKQLSVASHHGTVQFVTEIATISVVQHRNLVKLYGCCIEGYRRILVYEYLENKSLDQALFGKTELNLDWPTRFNICLGTARGLAYLHEESRPRIVHRDVKASNILLDAALSPKISDFGLAKLYDDNKTHISTRIAGTIGYLAPEYALYGQLTEKADVFGFGVVALEIVSGRPNFFNNTDNQKMYLLEWAWNLYESNQNLELVDSSLDKYDEAEVMRMIRVGLSCTQSSSSIRPSMSRVVGMLTGDIEIDSASLKPSYLTNLDLRDITSGFLNTQDTTTTEGTSSSGVSKNSSQTFTHSM